MLSWVAAWLRLGRRPRYGLGVLVWRLIRRSLVMWAMASYGCADLPSAPSQVPSVTGPGGVLERVYCQPPQPDLPRVSGC